MQLVIATAPTIEPISLTELKLHLRLDSGSFSDNIDETQSLTALAYAVADNYTTHVGDGIDVLGYDVVVSLICGINSAGGTLDVKIQESDDDSTYTDWAGGAFDQVTTDTDEQVYEIEYTGTKQYIRTVAKVLVNTCRFGTTVVRFLTVSTEDDLLTDIIQAARENVEDITRRALLTQTWDYYLDEFPDVDYFKLPFGNLQSITHVKYTNSAGTQTTMTKNTDYLEELNGDQCGRVVLPYDTDWPSFTAYTSHPIVVRFVAGWTAASSVPAKIRNAIKIICADMYEEREQKIMALNMAENKTVMRLLMSARLWDEF